LCQEAYQLSNGAFELSIFTFHLKETTHKLIYCSLKFFHEASALSVFVPLFMKLSSKKSYFAIRLHFSGTCFRTHQMTLSQPMSKSTQTTQTTQISANKICKVESDLQNSYSMRFR